VNIYGADKYDKILSRRNYAPGIHGQRKAGKKSEYAKQLQEKQKARLMFGITERQFQSYYHKADSGDGVTGEELLRLLERRLDNVIYRSGFASTRAQARQIVNHGLLQMNGKRVTIPSIQVRVGDKFEIRKRSAESPLFADIKAGKEKIKPPTWMKTDPKQLSIEILSLPEKDALEHSIEEHLIVEFYSKA
jgi:small subunit ribosomal protein S4